MPNEHRRQLISVNMINPRPLDSLPQDSSEATALELLDPKPTQVYHFDFKSFGSAKTQLLEAPQVKCYASRRSGELQEVPCP